MKGKFQGQAVRHFIEELSNEMRGFHADLAGWEHTNVDEHTKSQAL